MKKRIFTLAVLIAYFFSWIFLPFPTQNRVVASADTFAYIPTDSVYFYATKNEQNGLFLLPKTYFVKVLSVDGEYCRIEYLYDSAETKKVNGYAKTDELTFVDFIPDKPYLHHVFTVRYTIDGSFSKDESFLDQITVTCAYYGDYKIGTKTYCYVLRGDSFGYIPKPSDFSFTKNNEYEDYLSQQSLSPRPSTDEGESEGMSAAQIAILVTFCLLVPLLAALVFKSSKKGVYDGDENE